MNIFPHGVPAAQEKHTPRSPDEVQLSITIKPQPDRSRKPPSSPMRSGV